MPDRTIRYVALGDSYTICEGAGATESWPVILANHLTKEGLKTQLIANPSRTGYTTQDLIQRELSVFDASNADFATLCIGVNDWVQGIDIKNFHKHLNYILDHVQQKLAVKTNIILLTIPDFSLTPSGAQYAVGRDATNGIKEFNTVIAEEAKKRNLKLVDLFEISNAMGNDATLVATDGLHPSAKMYALWEMLVYPVAKELLKQE